MFRLWHLNAFWLCISRCANVPHCFTHALNYIHIPKYLWIVACKCEVSFASSLILRHSSCFFLCFFFCLANLHCIYGSLWLSSLVYCCCCIYICWYRYAFALLLPLMYRKNTHNSVLFVVITFFACLHYCYCCCCCYIYISIHICICILHVAIAVYCTNYFFGYACISIFSVYFHLLFFFFMQLWQCETALLMRLCKLICWKCCKLHANHTYTQPSTHLSKFTVDYCCCSCFAPFSFALISATIVWRPALSGRCDTRCVVNGAWN